jgi:hypothetical protein
MGTRRRIVLAAVGLALLGSVRPARGQTTTTTSTLPTCQVSSVYDTSAANGIDFWYVRQGTTASVSAEFRSAQRMHLASGSPAFCQAVVCMGRANAVTGTFHVEIFSDKTSGCARGTHCPDQKIGGSSDVHNATEIGVTAESTGACGTGTGKGQWVTFAWSAGTEPAPSGDFWLVFTVDTDLNQQDKLELKVAANSSYLPGCGSGVNCTDWSLWQSSGGPPPTGATDEVTDVLAQLFALVTTTTTSTSSSSSTSTTSTSVTTTTSSSSTTSTSSSTSTSVTTTTLVGTTTSITTTTSSSSSSTTSSSATTSSSSTTSTSTSSSSSVPTTSSTSTTSTTVPPGNVALACPHEGACIGGSAQFVSCMTDATCPGSKCGFGACVGTFAGCQSSGDCGGAACTIVTTGCQTLLVNERGLPSTMTLAWWTDVPATGTVEYSPTLSDPTPATATQAQQATCEVGMAGTCHRLDLTGLAADTRYYYRLKNGGIVTLDWSAARYFKTYPGPTPAGTLHLAVVSDFGLYFGVGESAAVAAQVNAAAPDLLLTAGDNNQENGFIRQWNQDVFANWAPVFARMPELLAVGNHDIDTPPYTVAGSAYQRLLTQPRNGRSCQRCTAGRVGQQCTGTAAACDSGPGQGDGRCGGTCSAGAKVGDACDADGDCGGGGSVCVTNNNACEVNFWADYGPIRIVVLDTHKTPLPWPQEQRDWLEKALTTPQPWKLVLFHHIPYGCAGNADAWQNSWNALLRAEIAPVAEKHDVDWVIFGHNHELEVSAPVDDYLANGTLGQDGHKTRYIQLGFGGSTLDWETITGDQRAKTTFPGCDASHLNLCPCNGTNGRPDTTGDSRPTDDRCGVCSWLDTTCTNSRSPGNVCSYGAPAFGGTAKIYGFLDLTLTPANVLTVSARRATDGTVLHSWITDRSGSIPTTTTTTSTSVTSSTALGATTVPTTSSTSSSSTSSVTTTSHPTTSTVSTTTLPVSGLAAPQAVRLAGYDTERAVLTGTITGAVGVGWAPAASLLPITSYEVQIATDVGYTQNVASLTVAGTPAVFRGLPAATAYRARVRAIDTRGTPSAWSDDAPGRTQDWLPWPAADLLKTGTEFWTGDTSAQDAVDTDDRGASFDGHQGFLTSAQPPDDQWTLLLAVNDTVGGRVTIPRTGWFDVVVSAQNFADPNGGGWVCTEGTNPGTPCTATGGVAAPATCTGGGRCVQFPLALETSTNGTTWAGIATLDPTGLPSYAAQVVTAKLTAGTLYVRVRAIYNGAGSRRVGWFYLQEHLQNAAGVLTEACEGGSAAGTACTVATEGSVCTGGGRCARPAFTGTWAGTYPRAWATPADLVALQARIAAGGAPAALFQAELTRARALTPCTHRPECTNLGGGRNGATCTTDADCPGAYPNCTADVDQHTLAQELTSAAMAYAATAGSTTRVAYDEWRTAGACTCAAGTPGCTAGGGTNPGAYADDKPGRGKRCRDLLAALMQSPAWRVTNTLDQAVRMGGFLFARDLCGSFLSDADREWFDRRGRQEILGGRKPSDPRASYAIMLDAVQNGGNGNFLDGPGSNQRAIFAGDAGLWAKVAGGTPAEAALADAWAGNVLRMYLQEAFKKAGSETPGYFAFGGDYALAYLIAAQNAGTDWAHFGQDPLPRLPEWLRAITLPDLRNVYPVGDVTDNTLLSLSSALAMLQRLYASPTAASLWDEWFLPQGSANWNRLLGDWPALTLATTLLYLDPTIPAAAPASYLRPGLWEDVDPRAWTAGAHAQGTPVHTTGFLAWTRDWRNPLGLVVLARPGLHPGFHGHADGGTVAVVAGKFPWLFDAGRVGGYGDPIAQFHSHELGHEAPLVNGVGEYWDENTFNYLTRTTGLAALPDGLVLACDATGDYTQAGYNPTVQGAVAHVLAQDGPPAYVWRTWYVRATGTPTFTWRLGARISDGVTFTPNANGYQWRENAGGAAALELAIAEPRTRTVTVVDGDGAGNSYDWRALQIRTTATKAWQQFAALLYPTDVGIPAPTLTPVATAQVAGFDINGTDECRTNLAGGLQTSGSVTSDATDWCVSHVGDVWRVRATDVTVLTWNGTAMLAAPAPLPAALLTITLDTATLDVDLNAGDVHSVQFQGPPRGAPNIPPTGVRLGWEDAAGAWQETAVGFDYSGGTLTVPNLVPPTGRARLTTVSAPTPGLLPIDGGGQSGGRD